jgi:hypothetical protein
MCEGRRTRGARSGFEVEDAKMKDEQEVSIKVTLVCVCHVVAHFRWNRQKVRARTHRTECRPALELLLQSYHAFLLSISLLINMTYMTESILEDRTLADDIAAASIKLFETLPKHGKPFKRANGLYEWTVLATISLVVPSSLAHVQPSEVEPAPSSSHSPSDEDHAVERCSICFPEDRTSTSAFQPDDHLTDLSPKVVIPISLGTGLKVLPATKLPRLGDTVHDSHAEVLARRGFVRWLIAECETIAIGGTSQTGHSVLEHSEGKFRLRQGVEIWLYVSTLPVG